MYDRVSVYDRYAIGQVWCLYKTGMVSVYDRYQVCHRTGIPSVPFQPDVALSLSL